MQPFNVPTESDHSIWPVVRPGHNTGRAPDRLKHPRGGVTWPRLPQSPGVGTDLKDSFIATLAHELRQPLSVLRTTVDLMRRVSDQSEANKAAEVMSRQIGRMSRLIEDVIEQTRWARGKLSLRKERLDICAVVREAVADTQSAAAKRRLALVIIADNPERLWIFADSHRIHQVLSNLLRNAVKFTDAGGRISVTVARAAAGVIVRIADTGCGIAPAALPHIFDLFSQVKPADAEGLGMGLSIVKEIVALHGGRIEARSLGPGQGSEFIVALPWA